MARGVARERGAGNGGTASWTGLLAVAVVLAVATGFFIVGPLLSGQGPSSGMWASSVPRLKQWVRMGTADGAGELTTGGVRGAGKRDPQGQSDRAETVGSEPVRAVAPDGPAPAPSCPAVPSHLLDSFGSAPSGDEEGAEKLLSAPGMPPVTDELPPRIVPSLYKRVYGEEPFERASNAEWELHAIPDTTWIDKAKAKLERCPLSKPWPGHEELSDEITIVSLLLDLKRGEGSNKEFQRPMTEYYARFQRIIDRGFKMVVFLPEEFEAHLRLDPKLVKVIHFTAADLVKYFPYYERLTAVRTSDVWNRQAKQTGWLANAPQARLPLYDPLVMSKMNLLRDVARVNPWKTKRLMFLDAGHFCATGIKPGEMPVFDKHLDKFFLTHWPYATATEVHGMLDKAMHMYMGTAQDPLRIVRGGVFGGERAHIECVAKIYNTALAQTLRDGYLGTEENILAIIYQRFPELFRGFDNNSLGNHGDNCAAFQANEIEVKKQKASL